MPTAYRLVNLMSATHITRIWILHRTATTMLLLPQIMVSIEWISQVNSTSIRIAVCYDDNNIRWTKHWQRISSTLLSSHGWVFKYYFHQSTCLPCFVIIHLTIITSFSLLLTGWCKWWREHRYRSLYVHHPNGAKQRLLCFCYKPRWRWW